MYIRQSSQILNSSMRLLLNCPQLMDFDNKRVWFRSQLRKQREQSGQGTIRIRVRREHLFFDSYNALHPRSPENCRGKLNVTFANEEAVDGGGVTREWYLALSREIFNPNYCLFKPSSKQNQTFQPDPRSYVNQEHLNYFHFIGRIIGKAIYDNHLLDAYFTRSFYKHMLGVNVTHEDMEALDESYYASLKWMLDNDITSVIDETFSTEIDEFGVSKIVPLKPGGEKIPVTNENKHEYVRLICEMRMTTAIKSQVDAFLKGFHEIIPRTLVSVFNENELELLISGLPDVDIDDLRANTEYSGYSASSPVVQWFWRVCAEMDKEEKARLLQFVTGTSKVPLEGFKSLQGMNGPQKFQIHKVFGDNPDRLPAAHTCFNQLDLPEYQSLDQLKERLLYCLREGNEGFGFA